MFQESFVKPGRNPGTRAVAFPLAVVFHAGVILGLTVLPLLREARLPPWRITSAVLVPPPSAPALPAPGRKRPAGQATRIQPVALRSDVAAGRLIAPVQIPDQISPEQLNWPGFWTDLLGTDDLADGQGGSLDAVAGLIIGVPGDEGTKPVPSASVSRPPRLIKRVEPQYPEIARQARVEGAVKVEAVTDVWGRVIQVRVIESVPLLDQAAVDAVRQWVYEPLVLNGRPRGVTFVVTLRFVLNGPGNGGILRPE
jgi:protein TonB